MAILFFARFSLYIALSARATTLFNVSSALWSVAAKPMLRLRKNRFPASWVFAAAPVRRRSMATAISLRVELAGNHEFVSPESPDHVGFPERCDQQLRSFNQRYRAGAMS